MVEPLNRRQFIGMGAAGLAALGLSARPQEADPFVVHEWGVLTVPHGATWAGLRSWSGEDARMPDFVLHWTASVGKLIEEWKNTPVIIDKPVLHFYSKSRRTVSVRVDVPTGRPKAWWPPAAEFGPKPKLPRRNRRGFFRKPPPSPKIAEIKPEKGFLSWTDVVVDPSLTIPEQPAVKEDQWWATARKIASTPIRRGSVTERFIFYDALAPFDPKLTIGWSDDGVPVPNRKGAFGLRVRDGKAAGLDPDGLTRALVGAGLYEDEAKRITEIWTPEFFRTDGARVLYLMERAEVDALLPMRITPAPDEFRRVMIVHVECLTPEEDRTVSALIEQLGDDDATRRDGAMEALKKLGPRAEGFLRRTHRTTRDPEIRTRVSRLLSGMGLTP